MRPPPTWIRTAIEQPFHGVTIVALRHEMKHSTGWLDERWVVLQDLVSRLPLAQSHERNQIIRHAARRTMSANGAVHFGDGLLSDLLHHGSVDLRRGGMDRHRHAPGVDRERVRAQLHE